MSHISTIKASLAGVNTQVMKAALEYMAEQHGGKLGTVVEEAAGRSSQTVDYALKYKELPRGIGVNVGAEGSVNYVGDSYQNHAAWNSATKEIEQTYGAYATMVAAQELGFSPSLAKIGENLEVTLVQ